MPCIHTHLHTEKQACSFLKGNREGVYLGERGGGEEGLGGVEGGEAAAEVYCMREEKIKRNYFKYNKFPKVINHFNILI